MVWQLANRCRLALQQRPNTLGYGSRSSRRLLPRWQASFSSNSTASLDESTDSKPQSLLSPKLQILYTKIAQLPRDEVNILGALVIQVLGKKIFPGEFGGSSGGALGAAAEPMEEVKEEKLLFDIKLLGFDAKAKIKVIKEVRAMGGLGLKEAKELVESAPKVIQKDMKPEKAEELKAQLEAIGAQVEIV
jgi:large subunit ribosomal protein L7/L12